MEARKTFVAPVLVEQPSLSTLTLQRCVSGHGPDIDAGAHADADAPFHFKRYQRLAYGRSGKAELFGEFPLCRQTRSDGVLAAVDHLPQLIGHLTVESRWFDGMDRHASLASDQNR